jgi:VanZ family protein
MVSVRLPRALSPWLPVLAWATLIFAFSSIPSLSSGVSFDEILRKGAHVTEYAMLAFLLWRATQDEAAAFFGAVLYAASDEFHQSFVRGRHGAPRDIAFDASGAFLGLLLVRYELGRRT